MPKKGFPVQPPQKAQKKNMVNLKFDEIPTQWYNILPDLPVPLPPPQDPREGPSRLKNLPNLMIGECLRQEFSTEKWIDISGGVVDLYAKAGRPRPSLGLGQRRDGRIQTLRDKKGLSSSS